MLRAALEWPTILREKKATVIRLSKTREEASLSREIGIAGAPTII